MIKKQYSKSALQEYLPYKVETNNNIFFGLFLTNLSRVLLQEESEFFLERIHSETWIDIEAESLKKFELIKCIPQAKE